MLRKRVSAAIAATTLAVSMAVAPVAAATECECECESTIVCGTKTVVTADRAGSFTYDTGNTGRVAMFMQIGDKESNAGVKVWPVAGSPGVYKISYEEGAKAGEYQFEVTYRTDDPDVQVKERYTFVLDADHEDFSSKEVEDCTHLIVIPGEGCECPDPDPEDPEEPGCPGGPVDPDPDKPSLGGSAGLGLSALVGSSLLLAGSSAPSGSSGGSPVTSTPAPTTTPAPSEQAPSTGPVDVPDPKVVAQKQAQNAAPAPQTAPAKASPEAAPTTQKQELAATGVSGVLTALVVGLLAAMAGAMLLVLRRRDA